MATSFRKKNVKRPNLLLKISSISSLYIIPLLLVIPGISGAEILEERVEIRRNPEKRYIEGEVLIKLKGGGDQEISALSRRYQVSPSSCSRQVGLHRVKLADGLSVPKAVKLLSKDPSVEYAEPNYVARIFSVPNDTYYNSQWSLQSIKAVKGWDISVGNADIKVGVVDTGVQYDHPDLKGQVINGYNFVNENNRPMDDHGHGTHVAGIIAAATNNNLGIAGLNWKCSIIPIKALDSGGAGSYENIIRGITYAVDNGARVINMSLGGYAYSQALKDAVDYALKRNCLVVAAAGNESTSQVSYPAGFPGVIAVASTDQADNHSYFSNYGPYISVAAPGQSILSTFISGQYRYLSGTSMATPHVTGLAALLLSKNPYLSPAEIKAVIEQTADDLGTPGRDDFYGNGRINITKALETLSIPGDLSLRSVAPDQAVQDSSINIEVTGSGFTSAVALYLIYEDKRLAAGDITVSSPLKMTARLNLKGIPTGTWALEAVDGASGKRATLAGALTIRKDMSMAPSAWPTESGDRYRRNSTAASAINGNQVVPVYNTNLLMTEPVVDIDGTIYITQNDGTIAALDCDGRLKWRSSLGARPSGTPSISAGGLIYVGTEDGRLHAFSRSGDKIWVAKIVSYSEDLFPPQPVGTAPGIGTDGTIYLGSDDWHIYCVSSDGKPQWSYLTGGKVRSSPAVATDGTIYIGSSDWGLYALHPDGTSVWKTSVLGFEIDAAYFTYGPIYASPVLGADSVIYLASSDGYIYAVAPSGETIWEDALDGPIMATPALDSKGRLYVVTAKGSVAAFNQGGEKAWQVRLGDGDLASPVVTTDSVLYVADRRGIIYALAAATGKLLWRQSLSSSLIGKGPAVNNDGALLVSTLKGLIKIPK
jgi:thermitase